MCSLTLAICYKRAGKATSYSRPPVRHIRTPCALRYGPDRAQRSDCLEFTAPNALRFIHESIISATQPSPCAMKKKHDYAPGNHKRSRADNSLLCVNADLCKEENVRYMMGTKLDLYLHCMATLQAAVRSELSELW